MPSPARTLCGSKSQILTLAFLVWAVIGPKASAQTSVLYEDFQGGLYNPTPNITMYGPFYHPGATETGFTDTTNFPPGTTQSLGLNVDFTHPYVSPIANGVAQITVASQYAPGASGGSVQPFNTQLGGSNPGAISLELYATVTTTFYLFLGDVNNTCSCGPGDTSNQRESVILSPVTIPANTWTNVTVPLDTLHWDSNLTSLDFTKITQVFIDAIAPPCSAAMPGGNYNETIAYGPISFLSSITAPTPTPADTPVWNCPTNTFTPTVTATFTITNTGTASPTATPTFTPTITYTPTITFTPTNSFTPTSTPTPCGYPGNTCTPTFTPVFINTFFVSQNLFKPANGPVSLFVEYNHFPGNYSLRVYNSAGERIKDLDAQYMNGPLSKSYNWDGTNNAGDKCASGVYLLYLIEPFDRHLARLLLVR